MVSSSPERVTVAADDRLGDAMASSILSSRGLRPEKRLAGLRVEAALSSLSACSRGVLRCDSLELAPDTRLARSTDALRLSRSSMDCTRSRTSELDDEVERADAPEDDLAKRPLDGRRNALGSSGDMA